MSTPDNVVAIPRRLPKYGDARIPPGEYTAILAGYETWAHIHKWAPRVVLVWTIADPPHVGVAIPAYYRVTRIEGKPRRNGRFLIGSKSRLYRDLARMLGRRPPTDRMPIEELSGVFLVVVRDVVIDRDNRPLDGAPYSVVEWVKGRA